MDGWDRDEGSPFPLGATWLNDEAAFNFALYSKHAERVSLLLFREDELDTPAVVFDFDERHNKSGPVWHCRLPEAQLRQATLYGYRVSGPPAGEIWHDFDSEKVLLDPYARTVMFPPGFDRTTAIEPGSNIGHAPLGLLERCDGEFDWGAEVRPHHGGDLVIYELHVRGFTQHPQSGVVDERRGTFAGVIEKIPYLQELGVTAVELMPVFQFDPGTDNYWGYMPLSFFAPHHAYAGPSAGDADCPESPATPLSASAPRDQFRQMVKALHAAGIQVILDVVFNHSCEDDHNGPTYSLRGIDASTYYLTTGNPGEPYADFSGCGNTLNTSDPAVRQLIIDSLRYWHCEMHVDGFRFDLASVIARRPDGSISVDDRPIFGQIAADPALANCLLIAEPWDAGGAYQLGRQFPGVRWLQWNGSFRDTVHRFVRGDIGQIGTLMSHLYGSADLFPDDRFHAYRPYQSVNYVTSHDGFTLYDLVSFNRRRNTANGENNLDGLNDASWNCGYEGDELVPAEVQRLRQQQVRNFACLLFLANGTPMLRMGDEFLQTQGGNNNPYNQDNETSWLDWSRLAGHRDVFRFFRELIALRKRHPVLGTSVFWRDAINWHGVRHNPDLGFESRSIAYCLHGTSFGDGDFYVMINMWTEPLEFGVHCGTAGQWRRLIDTSLPSPQDIVDESSAPTVPDRFYAVNPHTIVVLYRPPCVDVCLER